MHSNMNLMNFKLAVPFILDNAQLIESSTKVEMSTPRE